MLRPPVATATSRGIEIPRAELEQFIAASCERRGKSYRYAMSRLYGSMTVREVPQPGRPPAQACRRFPAYKNEGRTLIVPRACAAKLLEGNAIRGVEAPAWPDIPRVARRKLMRPLLPHHREIARFLVRGRLAAPWSVDRPDNGIVYLQAPTGIGKSAIAVATGMQFPVPKLIVVPTQPIQQQWIDEIKAMYPAARAVAWQRKRHGAVLRANVCGDDCLMDFVIVVVNTARDSSLQPAGQPGSFGMVIYDEVHEYYSEANSAVLWFAQAVPRTLGLSATPRERPDTLDRLVELHLGPFVTAPQVEPGVKFRGRVRILRYMGDPEYIMPVVTAVGTNSAIMTIGQLIEDPQRIALIVSETRRLLTAHLAPDAAEHGLGPRPDGTVARHGVMVFAEHREYLPVLRDALIAAFGRDEVEAPEEPGASLPGASLPGASLPGASSPSISVLRGGVAANAVADARALGAHVVVMTYGYGRRGVSLQEMTAMILASPRRHGMMQITGRIERTGSDPNIIREFVDIVDNGTFLAKQLGDRQRVYDAKKYEPCNEFVITANDVRAGLAPTPVVPRRRKRKAAVATDATSATDATPATPAAATAAAAAAAPAAAATTDESDPEDLVQQLLDAV